MSWRRPALHALDDKMIRLVAPTSDANDEMLELTHCGALPCCGSGSMGSAGA